MDLKAIEQLEYNYLSKIRFDLRQDLSKMIEGLNSKDKIKSDWIRYFERADKKSQNSDFARGAERIYFWLFNQFGLPNSAPIGADMFFETFDAFVHIDIKTAKYDNPSDYKGKVPLGINQTSYQSKKKSFNVHLPTFYNKGKPDEKICLTFAINIVYEKKGSEFKILAIILISVPNGELYTIYKDKIVGAGKNKGEAFRYAYINIPYFKLLDDRPKRVNILYKDKNILIADILGFELEE